MRIALPLSSPLLSSLPPSPRANELGVAVASGFVFGFCRHFRREREETRHGAAGQHHPVRPRPSVRPLLTFRSFGLNMCRKVVGLAPTYVARRDREHLFAMMMKIFSGEIFRNTFPRSGAITLLRSLPAPHSHALELCRPDASVAHIHLISFCSIAVKLVGKLELGSNHDSDFKDSS